MRGYSVDKSMVNATSILEANVCQKPPSSMPEAGGFIALSWLLVMIASHSPLCE